MEERISALEDPNGLVLLPIQESLLISGVHTGEFMGIPPTGKHVVCRFAAFDRIIDGKIVSSEVFMDTAGLLIQLGVMQPPKGF